MNEYKCKVIEIKTPIDFIVDLDLGFDIHTIKHVRLKSMEHIVENVKTKHDKYVYNLILKNVVSTLKDPTISEKLKMITTKKLEPEVWEGILILPDSVLLNKKINDYNKIIQNYDISKEKSE